MGKQKLTIAIVVLSVVVVILGLAVTVLQRQTANPQTSTEITPSPTGISLPGQAASIKTPDQSEIYIKSSQEIAKKEEPLVERESMVGQIYEYLPFKGINFRIEHDPQQLKYVITIRRGKEVEGNAEFDAFLKSHGVGDRSWIRPNLLVVQYE